MHGSIFEGVSFDLHTWLIPWLPSFKAGFSTSALLPRICLDHGIMDLKASDMQSSHAVSRVSSDALAVSLEACHTLSDIKNVHHQIVKNSLEQLTFLENHLIRAYDAYGSLEDGRKVFDAMIVRNVISWNIVIAAHVQDQDAVEALRLFRMMQQQGVEPSDVTVISALRACTNTELWEEAKLVHTFVVERGFISPNLDNAIFSTYAKYGSLHDAIDVFANMQSRNEVSWNAMISSHRQNGDFANALQLFRRMVLEDGKPGRATYMTLLNALNGSASLQVGRMVHVQFLSSNLVLDVILETTFLNMYRKFGSLKDARTLFDNSQQRNVVSWNVMIAAYAENAQTKEALELFNQMDLAGVLPDGITFVTILNTCTSPRDLSIGEEVHDIIIRCGMENDKLAASSLVSMYGKCGSLPEARTLVNSLLEDNIVAWNAMLACYAQCECTYEAMELYQHMQSRGLTPDKVTAISVARACSKPTILTHGIRVHVSILHNSLQSNVAVANAFVTMYSKCKKADLARKTFDTMSLHDIISWNTLMGAYAQQADVDEILKLLLVMHQKGVNPNRASFVNALDACGSPEALTKGLLIHYYIITFCFETDTMVGTALLTMYGKCGNVECARSVFSRLPRHDVVSWSAMIAMYGQQGFGKEAFQLFMEMASSGLMPNKVTYVSVLDACASVAALVEGKMVHACFMDSELEPDVVLCNALISMYGKCGSLENARNIFNKMDKRDVVSWSALIAAMAQHGHGKDAVVLFNKMSDDGVKPDSITYVSVLSACNHAGLVHEGCKHFDSMQHDHGITATEDHCLCMMDLFGRMGRLDEAEQYVRKIPGKPGILAWMTLLSACRLHKNLDKGQYAAEQVLELDPLYDTVYVMLANIYSAAGKWEEASKLRKLMAQRGIKKPLAWSSIMLDGRVHEFSAGDTSHPQIKQIHMELEKMSIEMKEMGYVPDTKDVLHDVSEEEKEQLLTHHSERLATAYGLISTAHGTPLHIIKNLRVCGDCHTATKYISKMTKRVIVVRDANRFHHFEDGVCSCGDYW